MSVHDDERELADDHGFLEDQAAHNLSCDRLDWARREKRTAAPRKRSAVMAHTGDHRAKHHAA